MKRDMDLIRSILLDIEESPAGEDWDIETIAKDKEAATVAKHLELMIEAGFVKGKVDSDIGCTEYWVSGIELTWEGYEFLDASRNSEVWKKVKSTVIDSGMSFSKDVLMSALKTAALAAINKLNFG